MRHPTANRWLALFAATAAAALLAGCSDLRVDALNRDPVARITADPAPAWTEQQVTFDLSASYDPDGRIEHYLLELGDGTTRELDREDDLTVTHTYARGGSYEVKLTVTDDGDDGKNADSDTETLRLAVHEMQRVDLQVLTAGNLTGNSSEQDSAAFEVRPDADRLELRLNATNVAFVGSSEIKVEVLDPLGEVLQSQDVVIDAGATVPVELDASLDQAGTHQVRVTATSGGASLDGELRILYG